jgi:hypothetical protein
MRAIISVPIAILILASASAQAGGIYQWKDAKGVTHYTDTPPPASEYKQRNIYNADPDVPADAKAKPAENPACATARNNIALLNSKQNVQLDSDGDGKPDKALSEQDRANQLALAQATLNTSCAGNQGASPAK